MGNISKWSKRVVKSKTMWLSAVGAAIVALEASFGLLQPFVSGSVYAWVAVGLSVGGAALRTVTDKPLSSK